VIVRRTAFLTVVEYFSENNKVMTRRSPRQRKKALVKLKKESIVKRNNPLNEIASIVIRRYQK
jgi:hypothetical protein